MTKKIAEKIIERVKAGEEIQVTYDKAVGLMLACKEHKLRCHIIVDYGGENAILKQG